MYVLNKIVGGMLNPISIALLFVLAGAICGILRRRRVALVLLAFAFSWLWIWSTAIWCRAIGLPLERQFPVQRAEDAPTADAIVVLGGGMTANRAVYPYADMSEAGDRVWHAARLYRAGKAPLVVPTGCNDRDSVVPLLLDLGVPSTALRVEDAARNTEENARFVATMLKDIVPGRKPRVKCCLVQQNFITVNHGVAFKIVILRQDDDPLFRRICRMHIRVDIRKQCKFPHFMPSLLYV